MESPFHGTACCTYVSAASKESCHLRHINLLIGTHADLVLQHTGLIHEDRTVDSLNIAQLVHYAIQISRYCIVEIHGLTVHHAHDAAAVHEAYALHQGSTHDLRLQIRLLIKALLNDFRKIKSKRDQKCCCLQCLRCRIGILEYAGIVDDAGVQCFRNISVNEFGIHDVIQHLAVPIQIAYYAGLRIGETCGLTWQDINLEDQCLTIKRSIRYDGAKHKNVIGTTKRKKVRIVDFGDTLTEILKAARREQLKSRMQYGELYHRNYYKEVHVKNRVYYEYYHLDGTQEVPADYKEISFVCLRPDGSLELPSTLGIACRSVSKKLEGFEDFHFHQLRHTYTSNLLSNGAAPKDVQELLGHSDVSTTMNIYAHSTRKAKRDSARLLDKVASNA